MNKETSYPTMRVAYVELLRDVLRGGFNVERRELVTQELAPVSFCVADAVLHGVPTGLGRKVGPKMMALDGLTHLSGMAWPRLALRTNPNLGRFTNVLSWDDEADVRDRANADIGELFHQGTYGPRLADQMIAMESQLREDPMTRQAVGSLWCESDREPKYHDRPCATEIQLMATPWGTLDIYVFMRANDLWTGTCYDVFQFGQVQAAMAHVLNVPYGRYHHYATSLHLYASDMDKAWNLYDHHNNPSIVFMANERETNGPKWNLLRPGTYPSWIHLQIRFRTIAQALEKQEPIAAENIVEEWYIETLGGTS